MEQTNNGTVRVFELAIHPVKSFAQQKVEQWSVDDFGFAGDRRWMVVSRESGRFITGRSHPHMVLLQAHIVAGGLLLEKPDGTQLFVPYPTGTTLTQVTVWNDTCAAHDGGDEAARWLSDYLLDECRLVYMPPSSHRQVSLKYATAGTRTGFADGFPFLLISEASLALLNSKLDEPVAMSRFRANIVVTGCEAHAEDSWKRIRIGATEFSLVKQCTRCVFTTVDPLTGQKSHGEPLKTLGTYRRVEKGIVFGMNGVHQGLGELQVGMPVQILE